MTKKEIEKLKSWKFGKKPIQGYLILFPESLKYLKLQSYWNKEQSEKGLPIIVYADINGFKINENSISCKTRAFDQIPSSKENIPFKYIQKVRFYDYNY